MADGELLMQTTCQLESLELMPCVSILQTASDLVGGDRNATHGNKKSNMNHTAALWSAYLAPILKRPITGDEVALCQVLLKVSRTMNGRKIDDNYVDMAGYAAIAGEVRE